MLPWEALLSEEALAWVAAHGRGAAHGREAARRRVAAHIAALQAAMAAASIHPPLVIRWFGYLKLYYYRTCKYLFITIQEVDTPTGSMPKNLQPGGSSGASGLEPGTSDYQDNRPIVGHDIFVEESY